MTIDEIMIRDLAKWDRKVREFERKEEMRVQRRWLRIHAAVKVACTVLAAALLAALAWFFVSDTPHASRLVRPDAGQR